MASQTITLTIAFDSEQDDAPAVWDWPAMLDVALENVTVVSASAVRS